jgi:hypothetical protein
MKHSDYFNMMVQVSGLITTDDTGNSTCTVCHGTGEHYEASVKHHKNCRFMKAIKSMQDIMPDKITPQVENSISLGMMLDSLSDLETEDMDKVSEFVEAMKEAKAEEERSHVAALIQAWCMFVKDEILLSVVEYGLPDKNAVETFKNYLIFERHNHKETLRMALELQAFEHSMQDLYPLFRSLLCDKYPHYKRTDAQASTR